MGPSSSASRAVCLGSGERRDGGGESQPLTRLTAGEAGVSCPRRESRAAHRMARLVRGDRSWVGSSM